MSQSNFADFSLYNNATIIVIEELVGLFINGELAYAVRDSSGEPSNFTRQQLWAVDGAKCEYDNFKTWLLSDSGD